MMKVAEIPGAFFLLIEVAQRDVEAHRAVAHGGRIKLPRLDLQAWVEIHGPFNNVALSARLDLGYSFLSARHDPALIRVPRALIAARLAFQQSALPHAALDRK